MKIRVGIVGCGAIAQRRHAPEYAANPDAEIAGFYDADPARAGSAS
jgi:predicted dehydrogenase